MKRSFSFPIALCVTAANLGCPLPFDIVPNGSDGVATPDGGSDVEGLSDEPDDTGNLVIQNQSNTRLILYRGEEAIRLIPNSSEDFPVFVEDVGDGAVDLKLFKADDVEDYENPPSLALFKRWQVVLAGDTSLEKRRTWNVTGDDSFVDSGTISLSYIGGTENSVDVYLNSLTGAKIATLAPGWQGVEVGIDFGTYPIVFQYWISNPNDADGLEVLGSIDEETVNGSQVPIYVVLNSQRMTHHLQVPHWNGGGAIEERYGNVQITNTLPTPVQIYAGDQLIEQVIYTDGSAQNASTIPANGSLTYTLPVGGYTLRAEDIIMASELDRVDVEIEADVTVEWDVGAEQ